VTVPAARRLEQISTAAITAGTVLDIHKPEMNTVRGLTVDVGDGGADLRIQQSGPPPYAGSVITSDAVADVNRLRHTHPAGRILDQRWISDHENQRPLFTT
jgi:hypothetical protein